MIDLGERGNAASTTSAAERGLVLSGSLQELKSGDWARESFECFSQKKTGAA